mgnify:CR=1 FL=1
MVPGEGCVHMWLRWSLYSNAQSTSQVTKYGLDWETYQVKCYLKFYGLKRDWEFFVLVVYLKYSHCAQLEDEFTHKHSIQYRK